MALCELWTVPTPDGGFATKLKHCPPGLGLAGHPWDLHKPCLARRCQGRGMSHGHGGVCRELGFQGRGFVGTRVFREQCFFKEQGLLGMEFAVELLVQL